VKVVLTSPVILEYHCHVGRGPARNDSGQPPSNIPITLVSADAKMHASSVLGIMFVG